MALSFGVSQFLCNILLVIGSVSLFLDHCASLVASSRKRNAPSMTYSLKVSSLDSPSLMFGGVLSRLSNCSNPIVVGVSPWSCWGSIIIMSVHSITICGSGPTGEGACPWFRAFSTAYNDNIH